MQIEAERGLCDRNFIYSGFNEANFNIAMKSRSDGTLESQFCEDTNYWKNVILGIAWIKISLS